MAAPLTDSPFPTAPSASSRPRSATHKSNKKSSASSSTSASNKKYVPVSSSPFAVSSSSASASASFSNIESSLTTTSISAISASSSASASSTNHASSSSAASQSTSAPSASSQDEFIGRPLVPFFLPGSEQMIENTEQKLNLPADEYKRVNGKVAIPQDNKGGVIRVRTFQDGYFSEPKEVIVKPSVNGNHENNHSSQKKKKKDKKGNPEVSVQSLPDAQTSTVKYANPSFFQSPDPAEIPLPRFLERFEILGDSLVPPSARSVSPVPMKADNRFNSPVGNKINSNPAIAFTPPVKSAPVGENVQKPDPSAVSTYELISPAKLKQSVSSSPIPVSANVVIPKPSSRLA